MAEKEKGIFEKYKWQLYWAASLFVSFMCFNIVFKCTTLNAGVPTMTAIEIAVALLFPWPYFIYIWYNCGMIAFS